MVEELDKVYVIFIFSFSITAHNLGGYFIFTLQSDYMRNNRLAFFLCGISFSLTLTFCGNNNQGSTNAVSTTQTAESFTEKFDKIERLYNNDHWLVVSGKDTSSFYCSRLGKQHCKVYQFRITKGDSTNTTISDIRVSADSIVWIASDSTKKYNLNSISDNDIVWVSSTDQVRYRIERLSAEKLTSTQGATTATFIHTGPLSDFLVLSAYDYKHGTKLALKPKATQP
jgi:hypothetical protein